MVSVSLEPETIRGYLHETVLGTGGAQPLGGQIRWSPIAHALLRGASVVLLDQPISPFDPFQASSIVIASKISFLLPSHAYCNKEGG